MDMTGMGTTDARDANGLRKDAVLESGHQCSDAVKPPSRLQRGEESGWGSWDPELQNEPCHSSD